jgi:hypothetical protein
MNSCELEQFVEIIVDVFPPGVSAHAVLIDSIDPSLVFLPPEIARSVEKRRREFAAGRICAQSALASLGGNVSLLASARFGNRFGHLGLLAALAIVLVSRLP